MLKPLYNSAYSHLKMLKMVNFMFYLFATIRKKPGSSIKFYSYNLKN